MSALLETVVIPTKKPLAMRLFGEKLLSRMIIGSANLTAKGAHIKLLRFNVNMASHLISKPKGVDIWSKKIANVVLQRFRDQTLTVQPTTAILYTHGGGFVLDGLKLHAQFMASLAKKTHADVFIYDYRVAPEHPFPAYLDDALNMYHYLLAQGYTHIVFAGDSAGGNVSLSLALKCRELNLPLPTAIVPLCPWVDIRHDYSDLPKDHSIHANNGKCIVLSKPVIRMMGQAVDSGVHLKNPLLSPIYGDFSNMPPMLFQVGGIDVLRDEGILMAKKVAAQGTPVILEEWEGMPHVWYMLSLFYKASHQATEHIAHFILTHTQSASTVL